MKKILILLTALILVTGFVYAQDYLEEEETDERAIEFFNWEFSIAYPVHWSNGMHAPGDFYPDNSSLPGEIYPDKTVTANTAIGTSVNFNFTRFFGLTLDFDFSYSTKLSGLAVSQSDSVSMFGMNVFLGPQFYIINSDRLRIPLAVGAHMYYFTDQIWMPTLLHEDLGQWVDRSDMQFGPGVLFGVQFHFDNSIYLFSRTSVYIDIVRMHKVEGQLWDDPNVVQKASHTDIMDVHWSIKPAIGIGVKF